MMSNGFSTVGGSKYPATAITRLAFRSRFTTTEKAAIELASVDSPSASTEQRMLTASLRSFLRDVDNANYIDLSLPETISGVNAIEQYGLISIGRAAVILSQEISEKEKPID